MEKLKIVFAIKVLMLFVTMLLFTMCTPAPKRPPAPPAKFPYGALVCAGSREYTIYASRVDRRTGERIYNVILVGCERKCMYDIREVELKRCN